MRLSGIGLRTICPTVFKNKCVINKVKIYAVTFILILHAINSFAQTKTIITLKQAVDSALLNYPELKAKQLLVESAKSNLSDAKNQRLPSLKLSDQVDLGTANSLDGPYFPMGIIPSTSGSIRPENTTVGFSGTVGVAYMEYELYNFGLNAARIASAKSLLNTNNADYDRESYLLQYQIAQVYFNLLRYKLLTDVQQRNIDRYRILSGYIKAYTGSGIKAGVDSSVANAEISKAKIQYIQTLAIYNKLKSEFMFYTGVKNTAFDVDTGVYHLSEGMINQMKSNVMGNTVGSNNPLLAYYKAKSEYAYSQQKLEKKSYLPKLNLLGAAWTRGSDLTPDDAYGNINNGFNYTRYNYLGGLALTYNIIDIVHQKDKAAIFGYQAQSEEQQMQLQQTALENQLQQADIDIQAALDRMNEIPVQLKAAQDAYSQKTAQYNAGLANIAELTDASYLLFSAETDQVGATTDLLNTLLQKAITNNTLNVFLNQFK